MAAGKQYDRDAADDWSIGCSDEREYAPSTRMAWTPDGPTYRSPLRDGRKRYTAGDRVGSQSNPKPRTPARRRPSLTLAQRAVRDYRRAWRRITA